jgi:arginine/ornithine transport system substrate-binding protein
MTRGLLIAAIVLLLGAGGGYWYMRDISQPRTLRVGVEGANPPFNYVDQAGALAGFDVDVANALCQRLHMRCEFVQQNWDGMVPGLLMGKYDAVISSMSITDRRKQMMNFTDPYYAALPVRFVARKDAKLEATAAGLAHKRIGVQRATVQERLLRAKFPEAVPVLYDSEEASEQDLSAGNLDLMIADQATLQGFLHSPAGHDFDLLGQAMNDPAITGSGAGIALRQEDGDLLTALNKALAAIKADGTYKKLEAKYFDFEIGG